MTWEPKFWYTCVSASWNRFVCPCQPNLCDLLRTCWNHEKSWHKKVMMSMFNHVNRSIFIIIQPWYPSTRSLPAATFGTSPSTPGWEQGFHEGGQALWFPWADSTAFHLHQPYLPILTQNIVLRCPKCMETPTRPILLWWVFTVGGRETSWGRHG